MSRWDRTVTETTEDAKRGGYRGGTFIILHGGPRGGK